MFARDEIDRFIPHRDPFVFVDEVVAFEPHRRAVGRWRLTGDECFWPGHFPAEPILPGVLILEHMAQTASFLVARSGVEAGERDDGLPMRRMVLGGVERARFYRPVRPGETLNTEVSVIKLLGNVGLLQARSDVDGTTVARARFQFGALT